MIGELMIRSALFLRHDNNDRRIQLTDFLKQKRKQLLNESSQMNLISVSWKQQSSGQSIKQNKFLLLLFLRGCREFLFSFTRKTIMENNVLLFFRFNDTSQGFMTLSKY